MQRFYQNSTGIHSHALRRERLHLRTFGATWSMDSLSRETGSRGSQPGGDHYSYPTER